MTEKIDETLRKLAAGMQKNSERAIAANRAI